MKRKLSLLLLVSGLFFAASTFTAFAGDEKKEVKKESCEKKTSCCKKAEATSCTKKAETKSTKKADTKKEEKKVEAPKKD